MSSAEVAGLDWAAGRLVPAFQSPEHLDVYEIGGASFDAKLAITTLVGLVNRPWPKVYLVQGSDEDFWLSKAFKAIPQTRSTETNDHALDALLETYHGSIQGLVIYNPNFEDSINIATMIAAQRDGMVVSPKLAQELESKYSLSVLADVQTYDWKSRLQAYEWALHNLRDGSSSRLIAGLDSRNMSLRSFLVATRTFIYNLNSRDYLPDFEELKHAELLSERELVKQILKSFQAGTTHLGWFPDGASGEASGVNLTSGAGIYVLATDNFNNLEVWAAVQSGSGMSSTQVPAHSDTAASGSDAVYLSFTMSDGDNLQYCQHRMKQIWQDGARGSVPIGWTISPSLVHAAPALAEYYISTATSNDELIAGPSGAGYMYPSHWPSEHLDAFLQLTGTQMKAMGLTTLEVLDATFLEGSGLPSFIENIRSTGMAFSDTNLQRRYVGVLRQFGLGGLLSGNGWSNFEQKLVDGLPFYQNFGSGKPFYQYLDPKEIIQNIGHKEARNPVKETVTLIEQAVREHHERPLFLNVYILAWEMGPSDLKAVIQLLGGGYQAVLPKTLLALLAQKLSQ